MLFVATGGTVDKLPVRLSDGSFDHASKVFGETHLPEMIEKAHFLGEYALIRLFMIDSLDMTEGHRDLLGVVLDGTEHKQIIVTHGTSTMGETAQALSRRSLLAAKTIVLTGAMQPYSMGEGSDAVANLESALAVVQTLPGGVYIVMDHEVFEADNVYKDREAGTFKVLR